MIYLEMHGRLGNQMFQYALCRKLQSLGKEVKLDLSFYRTKQILRRFELYDVFRVPFETASKREIYHLKGYTSNASRLERVVTTRLHRETHVYSEDLDAGFQSAVLEMDDVYLSGYWQNELYFKDIRKKILEDFRFSEMLTKQYPELLQEMWSENSVSIHIRRGDYLDPVNSRLYSGICTIDYYQRSIQYMQENLQNPKFYFFTDDPQWVKQNLYKDGMTIVEHQKEDPDYVDMFLMSQCKAHIIANSTFSWWGAWLDSKEGRIVISPTKWLNNHEVQNAICDWFIKVES